MHSQFKTAPGGRCRSAGFLCWFDWTTDTCMIFITGFRRHLIRTTAVQIKSLHFLRTTMKAFLVIILALAAEFVASEVRPCVLHWFSSICFKVPSRLIFLVTSPAVISHRRSPTLKVEPYKSQVKSHMIPPLTYVRRARLRMDKTCTAIAIRQLNFQRATVATNTVTIASIGAICGTKTNSHTITSTLAESYAFPIAPSVALVRRGGIVFPNNDVSWMIKCMAIVPLGIEDLCRHGVVKVWSEGILSKRSKWQPVDPHWEEVQVGKNITGP